MACDARQPRKFGEAGVSPSEDGGHRATRERGGTGVRQPNVIFSDHRSDNEHEPLAQAPTRDIRPRTECRRYRNRHVRKSRLMLATLRGASRFMTSTLRGPPLGTTTLYVAYAVCFHPMPPVRSSRSRAAARCWVRERRCCSTEDRPEGRPDLRSIPHTPTETGRLRMVPCMLKELLRALWAQDQTPGLTRR